MRIAEIFQSRQGEGLLTGTPSVFIRTSGCNLRCWFCDTPYTSWQPEGEDLSVDEIMRRATESASQATRRTGESGNHSCATLAAGTGASRSAALRSAG
jgi:7-carboxy-7-deazaguanine synthase